MLRLHMTSIHLLYSQSHSLTENHLQQIVERHDVHLLGKMVDHDSSSMAVKFTKK